ncbi:hypothetical protein [Streptomyces galilaeus]|uniref:hypothetical protein n=1 Tax=Streptomyces galilaeus TaxID=33899 RepID=UPI00188CDBE9|nr:hypothetical protein [Streptomyces galilaeus]
MERILRGDLPPGARADLKTSVSLAGVTRTGFYPRQDRDGTTRPGPTGISPRSSAAASRSWLQDDGEIIDPRAAQIERLKKENVELRGRRARRRCRPSPAQDRSSVVFRVWEAGQSSFSRVCGRAPWHGARTGVVGDPRQLGPGAWDVHHEGAAKHVEGRDWADLGAGSSPQTACSHRRAPFRGGDAHRAYRLQYRSDEARDQQDGG